MADQGTSQDPNGSADNGNKNGTGNNAWPMWQRLVLSELERHNKEFKEHCDKSDKKHDDLAKQVGDLRTENAVRQGKSAVIAVVAGTLITVLIQAGIYIANHYGK